MKKYSSSVFLIVFLFFSFIANGQNRIIDSLNVAIQNAKSDTAKMNRLNDLSWEHLMLGNSDSAIVNATRALKIAEALESEKGLKACARSYQNIAMGTSDKGDFAGSIAYFLKALKIGEELNNKSIISSNLSNIANVYGSMGEFDKGLEYLFRALKIAEEVNDKKAIANDLGNIGNLYDYKNEPEKALEYYQKALVLCKELNYKQGLGANLGNMGLIYQRMGQFEKAATQFMQGLIIAKELGDQRSLAINEGNIGELFLQQIPTAEGEEKKKFIDDAESHLLSALAIDTVIKFLHHQEHICRNLSELYELKGDYHKALEYYKLHTAAKDSLFNEQKQNEFTRAEMTYEFEKKEALAEADKKRQTIVLWLIVIVAIAVAVIAVLVFRSLRIARRQKDIIEQKQQEILDSIQYAKRIQQSLLPTEKYIEKNINRLRDKP